MSHVLLHASARFRLFLARHRSIYWIAVGSIALGAGGVVSTQVAAARDARAAWTETRTVLVAAGPIAAGATIEIGDVQLTRLPRGAVPPSAITALKPDTQARHDLATGEVLLEGHTGPATAGELSPGARGVAIPLTPGSLPVEVGTIVDLVAIGDPLAGAATGGTVIADQVVVVAVTDEVAVVGVDQPDAPNVAAAANAGRIVVVWTSGTKPSNREMAPSPQG